MKHKYFVIILINVLFLISLSACFAENCTDIYGNEIPTDINLDDMNNINFVINETTISQYPQKSLINTQNLSKIEDNSSFGVNNNSKSATIYPTLYVCTDVVYQSDKLSLYIVDHNFQRINLYGESVVITIHGVPYTRYFDEYGIVSLNINLDPDNYTASFQYYGDSVYLPYSGQKVIEVKQKKAHIIPFTTQVHSGNTGYGFKAKLIDEFGVPIANRTVKIQINQPTPYERVTDSNGVVNLNINLNTGYYPMAMWYDNGRGYSDTQPIYWYLNVVSNNNLNQPKISFLSSVIPSGTQLQVKLTSSGGVNIAGRTINLLYGNNNVNVVTNSNGVASITISSSMSYYTVVANFAGDNYYKSCSAYKLILVPSSSTSNDYSSSDPNGGTEYNLYYYQNQSDSYCNYSSSYFNQLTTKLISSCGDDLEKAIAINFHCNKLQYEGYSNNKYGGLESLLIFKGNCADHTNALVALSKASNLPVRYVFGYVSADNKTGHAWAQICIDNQWIVSEPTNTFQFGYWLHGATYPVKEYYPLSSMFFDN